MLCKEYYTCYFEESAIQALDILDNNEISAIVADYKIPNIDGSTLLRIVKDKYPNIVRIILSGHIQFPDILKNTIQNDTFKVITKPWNTELKIVLEKALAVYNINLEKDNMFHLIEMNAFVKGIIEKEYSMLSDAIKDNDIKLCRKITQIDNMNGLGGNTNILASMIFYRYNDLNNSLLELNYTNDNLENFVRQNDKITINHISKKIVRMLTKKIHKKICKMIII